MSVSAISQSTVLATAPAPKRLHYGELGAEQQRYKAMGERALQLVEKAGGVKASLENEEALKEILKQEFGIDDIKAGILMGGGNLLSKSAVMVPPAMSI